MQRLRAYWQTGCFAKTVLGTAAVLVGSCFCTAAVLVAVPFLPEPTAAPPVAQPTTQETDPTATPNNIELAVATLEVLEAATPTARPTRTPAPTRTPRPTEKPDRQVVRAADYGDAWPFTVESGTVRCVNGQNGFGEVVFMAEGKVYAVNGVAKQAGQYEDIDPIWKDNLQIEGTKISIGPIIDLGLSLC